MSDRKSRKRDRFLGMLRGVRRPESPAERMTGPYSIDEPSTHTPAAASSTTSVANGVTGLNETTQHLITPTEPVKPQPRDATFKPNPGQPGPTSASAAEMGTAHNQVPVGNGGEQSILTVAVGYASVAQSLWSRAINSDELSSQVRKTLSDIGFRVDSRETVSDIRSLMDDVLSKKKGGLWKVKFRGEEVVLRDVGMKILRWVDKFKQIGDTIVQFDPVHAALPWAGFRFLLQVDSIRSILN